VEGRGIFGARRGRRGRPPHRAAAQRRRVSRVMGPARG
jgi:hypothetical protein